MFIHETDFKSCLCQVALLVQFLIENSGEIFGGDIASLFQRLDKKKSKTSEASLGKLVVLCLPERFKIFYQITLFLTQKCAFPSCLFQGKALKNSWVWFSLCPSGIGRHRGQSRGLRCIPSNASLGMVVFLCGCCSTCSSHHKKLV